LVFFFSFNLLSCWQLSIWNCCKPFFALLYNCQLLCFWRLAFSIAVEVFPWPSFSGDFPFKDVTVDLGSDPKSRENTEGEKKEDWCEDERRLSVGRYSKDGVELGARKRYSRQWVMSFV
jgi:hypothetical protein